MSEAFAQAFLAAQKEFPTIPKTKLADMDTYSYKYADLGDVLDAAVPILHKHGLAFAQPPAGGDGMIGVTTRIYHESGHVEDFGTLLLPVGKNPQAAGSALTYARRYAACAALGIVADEDDDGHKATKQLSDEEVAVKLQNRLKAAAYDLAAQDKDLAQEFFDTYSPAEWTKESVEAAENEMVRGVTSDAPPES